MRFPYTHQVSGGVWACYSHTSYHTEFGKGYGPAASCCAVKVKSIFCKIICDLFVVVNIKTSLYRLTRYKLLTQIHGLIHMATPTPISAEDAVCKALGVG